MNRGEVSTSGCVRAAPEEQGWRCRLMAAPSRGWDWLQLPGAAAVPAQPRCHSRGSSSASSAGLSCLLLTAAAGTSGDH